MLLLIPGPVMTRPEVRAAAGQDFAPWDRDFAPILEDVLGRLLRLAGGSAPDHVTLPVQGCGHFAIEAAIRTFLPPGGKILIPAVGQYAERMTRLAVEAGRVVVPLAVPQVERVGADPVGAALAADPAISHVGIVYSETGTGIIHDAAAIGAVARAAGRRVIVDAISAFGALAFDIGAQPEVDAVVLTANKCLEGLPGIAFAVCRADRLEASVGQAGSWSLDLADIHRAARASGAGYARFTPPAQIIVALRKALDLLDAEGGPPARLARYTANMRTLVDGVTALGLALYLRPEMQGPIVVNFAAPADKQWDLQHFVDRLKARGVLISNFYNTERPSFRVGCIGAVTPADMRFATAAIGGALGDLGIRPKRAAA